MNPLMVGVFGFLIFCVVINTFTFFTGRICRHESDRTYIMPWPRTMWQSATLVRSYIMRKLAKKHHIIPVNTVIFKNMSRKAEYASFHNGNVLTHCGVPFFGKHFVIHYFSEFGILPFFVDVTTNNWRLTKQPAFTDRLVHHYKYKGFTDIGDGYYVFGDVEEFENDLTMITLAFSSNYDIV